MPFLKSDCIVKKGITKKWNWPQKPSWFFINFNILVAFVSAHFCRCKPSLRLNFEAYFPSPVLLTAVADICRLSLLPVFLVAFLNVSFGKHFISFTVSALGDISPCFLWFLGKVSIASTIIVAECRKQRFTLWQPLFFIFIIPASGCISSRFLWLFLKALLIVLTGSVASATKQRWVCQLCIICKRLITLSQIRQPYKKQVVVSGRGLQQNTSPDRQQRCFFWNALFRINVVVCGRSCPACWRPVSSSLCNNIRTTILGD